MRLLGVLGASEALGDHLVRHPEHWRELTDPTLGSTRPAAYAVRAALLRAVGADPQDPTPVATLPDAEAVDALRVEYRRVLLRLAARDLAHHLGVDDAAAELSDLAAGTLDAALAVARQRVGAAAATARLAVIAMGKCGGHELNYVSDVDVIFVAEPRCRGRPDEPAALRAATQLASPPDADLRRPHRRGHHLAGRRRPAPRGQGRPAGAHPRQPPRLLRALGQDLGVPGAAQGPRRWPATCELGRAFVDMVAPMVWSAAERDGFVADVQAMRRRVLDHIPAREAERQLKLGSGGLRDVEFAVQLLQLVHGRADERLRRAGHAERAGRADRGRLRRPRGRRGHARRLRLPAHPRAPDPALPAPAHPRGARRRGVAAPAGPVDRLPQGPGRAARPAVAHHRREVRRLHEKLFYRPLLAAVARIPGDEARLSPEAAEARLAALGLRRPEGRAAPPRGADHRRHPDLHDPAHPAAGAAGVVRRRARPGRRAVRLPPDQRGARPHAVVPQDAARRGRGRPAPGPAARHLPLRHRPARARAAGRQAARRGPRSRSAPRRSPPRCWPPPSGRTTPEAAVRAIRAVRRRELLRIAAGDLHGLVDVADVGTGLSRLTDATLEATLDVAQPVRGGAARARRAARPGWRWSPWAATAASSCPTAATPT